MQNQSPDDLRPARKEKAPRDGRLGLKTHQELRVVEQMLEQDLERHGAVAHGDLLGEKNLAHSAFTQFANQTITGSKARRQIGIAGLHHAHQPRAISRAEVRVVIVGPLALRAGAHQHTFARPAIY